LDIEKAFNTTLQPLLLYEFKKLKFSASISKLSGSFPSNIKFSVPVKGEKPASRELKGG